MRPNIYCTLVSFVFTQRLSDFMFISFVKNVSRTVFFFFYLYLLLELLWLYFCFDLSFVEIILFIIQVRVYFLYKMFTSYSYTIIWSRPYVFFLSDLIFRVFHVQNYLWGDHFLAYHTMLAQFNYFCPSFLISIYTFVYCISSSWWIWAFIFPLLSFLFFFDYHWHSRSWAILIFSQPG